ncbi:putative mitochondrial protein [Cucumis melo var. makuwa]|uniref:Mitochondrial protein n=1 Tax=Cucumis melo var. makuwa TaxID=1194695 RepID=A0A5A7UE40_CUCMM|nr:putative mitochondrial protein [Cucumis melo var. makuwa]
MTSMMFVPENVEEKDSGDKSKVGAKSNNNEAEQSHSGKLDEYSPLSGHSHCTEKRAFTVSLDSTRIPKNIHTAKSVLNGRMLS